MGSNFLNICNDPSTTPTPDTYLCTFYCNLSEGNWRFLIFSIFPCGSKSKLALKTGRFFNGTQIDWMWILRKKLLRGCNRRCKDRCQGLVLSWDHWKYFKNWTPTINFVIFGHFLHFVRTLLEIWHTKITFLFFLVKGSVYLSCKKSP